MPRNSPAPSSQWHYFTNGVRADAVGISSLPPFKFMKKFKFKPLFCDGVCEILVLWLWDLQLWPQLYHAQKYSTGQTAKAAAWPF